MEALQTLFDFVMNHPFWALYVAILLGIAIHGFRPASKKKIKRIRKLKKQQKRPGVFREMINV